MMKKQFIGLTLILTLFLAACNEEDEVTEEAQTATPPSHHYTEFSLDVDYANKEDYDAIYELENGQLEASIEDDRNQEKLDGNKAYDKLNALLEKLTFDATTSEDKVIAEVLQVFNLDNNFTEFDLDVTFHDGTKTEYKQTK